MVSSVHYDQVCRSSVPIKCAGVSFYFSVPRWASNSHKLWLFQYKGRRCVPYSICVNDTHRLNKIHSGQCVEECPVGFIAKPGIEQAPIEDRDAHTCKPCDRKCEKGECNVHNLLADPTGLNRFRLIGVTVLASYIALKMRHFVWFLCIFVVCGGGIIETVDATNQFAGCTVLTHSLELAINMKGEWMIWIVTSYWHGDMVWGRALLTTEKFCIQWLAHPVFPQWNHKIGQSNGSHN